MSRSLPPCYRSLGSLSFSCDLLSTKLLFQFRGWILIPPKPSTPPSPTSSGKREEKLKAWQGRSDAEGGGVKVPRHFWNLSQTHKQTKWLQELGWKCLMMFSECYKEPMRGCWFMFSSWFMQWWPGVSDWWSVLSIALIRTLVWWESWESWSTRASDI